MIVFDVIAMWIGYAALLVASFLVGFIFGTKVLYSMRSRRWKDDR